MIHINGPEALYMTAQEAAATLSVSPATIYAYVSRGLIRSESAADGRNKRYRADDIHRNTTGNAGGLHGMTGDISRNGPDRAQGSDAHGNLLRRSPQLSRQIQAIDQS